MVIDKIVSIWTSTATCMYEADWNKSSYDVGDNNAYIAIICFKL